MNKKQSQQKRKQKKVEKKKAKKASMPVPAVSVPQRKVVPLDAILERIYTKEDLSTTCLRQCTCCRVACPQMKYCEASSIIDHIWATQTKEFKKKILITAIRYYFSDSLVKPCMLLEGKTCAEYARRSLNCRLYGLWPSDSWEDRVKMFSKATGLPREKLPLNTQCPNVKRAKQVCKDCKDLTDAEKTACKACGGTGWITPPPLTSEQISALFEQLDKADTVLGISELKVSTSWNYRTFHDWVLLKFWGENALSQWTNIILNTSPEQRHNLVEAVVEQANKMDV